jgi:antitoxin HicB
MTPTMLEQTTSLMASAPTSGSKSRRVSDPEVHLKTASAEYYKQLEYPIELVPDEGAYVASNPDLPGCVSFGDSPNEAIESLREVRDLWIDGQVASGHAIPEPSAPERFSGKFVLRIPKTLHRMADLQARREGVSLNTYITSVLASGLAFASQARIESKGDRDRMKFWCKPMHGWQTGRFGESWRAHGISSEYGLFVTLFANKFKDSSIEKLDTPWMKELHHV